MSRHFTIQKLARREEGFGDLWTCCYYPDLVYAVRDGVELKLQLIVPRPSAQTPQLIVYIQGSGWGRQDPYAMLPQLGLLAAHNFAVASVAFRDSSLALFPACLEDTKEALRYLRAHAEEYGFDASRAGAWGTSSGGHIAAMLGLTEGRFRSGAYLEQSDAVQAVADCYGPTDLLTMDDYPGVMRHNDPASPESLLIGGPLPDNKDRARAASPCSYVADAAGIPPFLILHGTADDKVPKEQSMALAESLSDAGADVRLLLVEDAGHGNDGGVLNAETLETITDFFSETLKKL